MSHAPKLECLSPVARPAVSHRPSHDHLAFTQSVLDTAPAGIFSMSENGSLLRCNDELTHLLGRCTPPTLGTDISNLLGTSVREAMAEFSLARKDLGSSRGIFELALPRKGLQARCLQLVLGSTGKGSNEVFTGIVIDITELKSALTQVEVVKLERAEATRLAARSTEKLSRFFEVSQELLCMIGTDGYFQELNPSWQRVLGHRTESLFCVPFIELVHPDDRADTFDRFERLTLGEDCPEFENRFLSSDGQYRWLRWSATLDPDNGVVVASARDVTERAETLLELQKAKAAAEAASQAKSHFLSNMSHELRTPLNSIIGFSTLVAASPTLKEAPRDLLFLNRVAENGKHLLALINDILDISKVESGQLELEAKLVDVGDAVQQVVRETRVLGERRGLSLCVQIQPELEPARIDPFRLKQVLLNLVSNAIKFTKRGQVRVCASQNPSDPSQHLIEVIDTGIGVAPEKLAVIFDPFRQAESSTSRKYGGTGLGLAISRSLCEQMGIRLTVKSTVGQGSVFSLVIPQPAHSHVAALSNARNNPSSREMRHH